MKAANPQANDVAYNAEVKPHSQNQTKPRKAYGKSKTKLQGSQTEEKLQGTQTDRAYRIIRSRIGKQKSLITREYKLVLTMSRSKYFNRNILRL